MPLIEYVQALNNLHKSLRELLTGGHSEEPVIRCVLSLHGQLHSSAVSIKKFSEQGDNYPPGGCSKAVGLRSSVPHLLQ